jgi:thiamine biosynthesis lipoprotein
VLESQLLPNPSALSLVRLKRFHMGTQWEIVVPSGTPNPVIWADLAYDALALEEARLSVFHEHSEVSRLNRTPVGTPRRLSDELFLLLNRCWDWWQRTDGCLDVAAGKMVQGWGFLHGPPRIPEEREREIWKAQGGMRRLELFEKSHSALWNEISGDLNLGAVGKGFGLDQMAKVLRRSDWPVVMIHGGRSSVIAWGKPPGENRGWRVALRHPRRDSILAEVEIIDGAMGTTAPTYKHLNHQGQLLGHVLDPRGAWPAMMAETVSVLAPDATEADALSTAIFVGGPALAEKLVQNRNDLGVLYLPANGPLRLFGCKSDCFQLK